MLADSVEGRATPNHQIRAHYDTDTITVYQAYSASIASAAVKTQNLSASPEFRPNRMTWIKPSWCWMMYRCGYTYKDPGQECVLALKMKHEHFAALLSEAQLAHHGSTKTTGAQVIVQWDPERSPWLEKYDYRSIQIGMSGEMVEKWVKEWICGIEDVTWKARELKKVVDEDLFVGEDEELKTKSLMPYERVYEVSDKIAERLGMERL